MSRELSPLGELIEGARAGLGISGREVARRANITEARWRQVVRGTQSRAYGTVRMPWYTPAPPGPIRVTAAVGQALAPVERRPARRRRGTR